MSKWLTLTDWDMAATIREQGKTAWQALSDDWRAKFPHSELSSIDYASYVITISSPFTIDYPKDHSPIIYIGEGMFHARLKDHLPFKIEPMQAVFGSMRFDFWALPCPDKQTVVATEAKMLAAFADKYGRKPFFNEQAGKACNHDDAHPAWSEPMDNRRRGNRTWALRHLR